MTKNKLNREGRSMTLEERASEEIMGFFFSNSNFYKGEYLKIETDEKFSDLYEEALSFVKKFRELENFYLDKNVDIAKYQKLFAGKVPKPLYQLSYEFEEI